jgi:hypothetical protein
VALREDWQFRVFNQSTLNKRLSLELPSMQEKSERSLAEWLTFGVSAILLSTVVGLVL